ncbi:hypothetical protein GIB67_009974 [Kingdonia uniflora]|uniref:Cyclin-like domain-containing protein n=1 Tax=Kingdonia uniflora TaxID=39325 RepID=A0A7J7L915_9MAGN|nr:hypothetical protein GIB67_009974 [Kingdonia uniflora]
MADFQTSTHRAKWIFAPNDLVAKYKATNHKAIQVLKLYGTTRMEVNSYGSWSYPEPQSDAKLNGEKRSLPKPLNVEEEQLMRVFYEQKIQAVCKAFNFPHKIQATAIIYFKRFYLQWSVMEHHPKHIMLTCIYASCKIEENHVSAEELGKGIQQDHQSLGFDLIVYAPYRSIEGFIDVMEDFCQARNGQLQMLKDLVETAKLVVDEAMLTDAPLLFPPGQGKEADSVTFSRCRRRRGVSGSGYEGGDDWKRKDIVKRVGLVGNVELKLWQIKGRRT